ncbi:MAG TPA: signal peptidase I [Virgibacillus sp.]|nr:signal peptidase I [Virgibacillus sp.]HLR67912.1 signal peptidase I [Virgibacillus sp.]
MKKTFKVISNIITTCLLIVLLIMISLVIATKASGNEHLDLFGYQFKTVLSGSMEPHIDTGSVISIRSVDKLNSFKKGDIITYQTNDDTLVTHRIVEVKNQGEQYITKGDNNDAPDIAPVLAQNIVGTYSGLQVPYLGYIVSFYNSPAGSALFMILPGLLLISYAGYTIWSAIRDIEDKNQANT